jgi:hypothetical protein
MIPAVKLKHGSTIRTFDYDESQSLQSLQAAVSATTGVPADRMKLMVKGRLIKVGQPGLTQRLGTTELKYPYSVAWNYVSWESKR